jgi:glutathione S-transferase
MSIYEDYTMKLHTTPGSPSGRRVQAVILHLKLEVEVQHYNFFKGELRQPEYLALNLNGSVPTLVDGDFVLWESNAITQYLADTAGDTQLFPRDLRMRADVVRWQCWELAHFNKAFGMLAFETVAKPRNEAGAPDPVRVELAKAELARYAPVLDAHMARREYIVGRNITLADYSMLQFEGYRPLVPFDFSAYANLNAYFDHARTVDAWQRSAPSVAGNAKAA